MAKKTKQCVSSKDSPRRKYTKKKISKILTLKERVLAIRAYYRKPIYQKVAKKFQCDWEHIKNIIKERKAILDYYELATVHHSTLTAGERKVRLQKIKFMEECMYEYVKRAQYNNPSMLENRNLIAQASEFSYLMRIKNFIPTRKWLTQFKQDYNIPPDGELIPLYRMPRNTLVPKRIMEYCKQKSEVEKVRNEKEAVARRIHFPQVEHEDSSKKLRRQKIGLLEKAVYEFMQRAQYHHNTWLSEDLQIDIANRLNKMINIENFTPGKTWIKHFKLHYHISTSQRMVVVNRVPPTSLDLEDILKYCEGILDTEENQENHNKSTHDAALECIEIEEEAHLKSQPEFNIVQLESQPNSPQTVVNLEFQFHDVEIKSDLDDVQFDLVNNKNKELGDKTTFRIRQLDSKHGENTAVAYRVQLADEENEPHDLDEDENNRHQSDFDDDVCFSTLHKSPALKTYSVRRKKASSNRELKSVTEPVVKPATTHQNFTTKKTFSLEDQVQIIDDYDRKLTVSQIAEMFNCELEDIKKIIQNRGVIMDCHHSHLTNSMFKKQKMAFLGECMCEFMRRADYHVKAKLNDESLISIAREMNDTLKNKIFIPSKSWLDYFKELYKKQVDELQQSGRPQSIPPALFGSRQIIAFCRQQEKLKQNENDNNAKNPKQDQAQVLRQHKIATLERALYEYIRRSQYHKQMPINEDLLIRVALDLDAILRIDRFKPNKNWLKHFKLHFNISTSQRMIVVESEPPASLDLRDILSYCHRCYERKENQLSNTTETTTTEDVNEECEGVEAKKLNMEAVGQGIDQAQIGNDLFSDQTVLSDEHMEIEQTLETPQDITEVDIKPIVMDIKIEQPEVQPICESIVKAEEVSEPPILKTATTSPIVDSNSDDDEVMPKVTNSYEEALKKLKSLEEFALLEENYRAIGLITQLESIFKNPPIREK